MNITYVKKEEIYPLFGVCYKNGTIKIREDLPPCVKAFLEDHELLHGDDWEKDEKYRELESNWGGFTRHPWGFIVTAVMSLAPYRLKLYYQQFKKGR